MFVFDSSIGDTANISYDKSFTLKKINKISVSSRFILYFTPFALSLQQIRSCRLDWDTHQIIMKTGISSSANGGPQHLRV